MIRSQMVGNRRRSRSVSTPGAVVGTEVCALASARFGRARAPHLRPGTSVSSRDARLPSRLSRMFDATGVSRRPERFGERAEDPDRDALGRALEAFEARVDADDPEQVAALESLRRETRELERLRGVWCDRTTRSTPPARDSVLTHASPRLPAGTGEASRACRGTGTSTPNPNALFHR